MRPPGPIRPEQSAAEHFGALQRQSRPRRWLAAILVGAAEGLFMGLVLPWWLALPSAVLTMIGLLVWDHRRGVLAGMWPGDPGPHRLAAAMARLERRGWTVLRNPRVPNQPSPRLSYLLVGPGGVVVVEHQVWTVVDTVTTSPDSGLLLIRGRPAARRVATVRAMTAAVDEVLSDTLQAMDIPVRPVVAVEGKTLNDRRDTIGVTLVPVADLPQFLRGIQIALSAAEITTLAGITRRLFTRG